MMKRLLALCLAGMAIAQSAFAHTGVGDTTGVLHGFLHPISGIDHMLAMVAVGLFAALLGGRALWLVPLSFVTMMAIGGSLGWRRLICRLWRSGSACQWSRSVRPSRFV
jgi:urease accessory protein